MSEVPKVMAPLFKISLFSGGSISLFSVITIFVVGKSVTVSHKNRAYLEAKNVEIHKTSIPNSLFLVTFITYFKVPIVKWWGRLGAITDSK